MRFVSLALLAIAVAGCTGSTPAPEAPSKTPVPEVTSKPDTPAPSAPVQSTFAPAPGWDGPAITASRPDATGPLMINAAAPTAGYAFTLDGVVVKDGAREVQVTLLQPPGDAQVGRVVSELELQIEAAKLAGKEPLAVAVRQMQEGCHYLVAPAWRRAVIAAK